MGENIAEVLNAIEVDESEDGAEEESYIDPDQAVVTKVKRWDCGCCFVLFGIQRWLIRVLSVASLLLSNSNSFDLSTPISIKEAIFALDYIDHDFYVFRDEETNEVSVVYKRNAGGVGLIQPEQ